MTRGEIIKKRRLDLGLSQIQLAEMAKISKPFVSQIENNNRNFSVDVLINLSTALYLPIEEIIIVEPLEDHKMPQIDRIEHKINILLGTKTRS